MLAAPKAVRKAARSAGKLVVHLVVPWAQAMVDKKAALMELPTADTWVPRRAGLWAQHWADWSVPHSVASWVEQSGKPTAGWKESKTAASLEVLRAAPKE